MQYWEKDNTTAVLKFYGPISTWYNGANDFTDTFRMLQLKYKNIDIRVHCYGGDVLEGSVIYNAIAQRTSFVHIIIDGVSASMMSICMLPADKISMAENAFIMIHAPSGYVEGTSAQVFSVGKLLKSMEKNFARDYVRKTGMKESDAVALLDGVDHWIDSEEAKTMKLVDEVITPVVQNIDDLSKPDNGADIKNLFGRYAALLTASAETLPTNSLQNKNQSSTMKKDLIKKFNLQGVDENSSDTAVIEAMNNSVAAMHSKINTLEASQKTLVEAQSKVSIEAAEKVIGKKFTDAEKVQFMAIGEKAGIEALTAVLNIAKPAEAAEQTEEGKVKIPDINAHIKGDDKGKAGIPKERETWTFAEWSEKDHDALEEMRVKNFGAFNAIYKRTYKVDAPKD